MTKLDIKAVLSRVLYKDWRFHLEDDGALTLQVVFNDPNDGSEQRCRRWLLSADPSPSDVVRTALTAVLVAEEHEAREAFTYRSVAVFSPHLDVDDIANGVLCGTLGGS